MYGGSGRKPKDSPNLTTVQNDWVLGYRLRRPKEAPRGWLLCKGKRMSALSQALNACAASIFTPNRFHHLHFLAVWSPNESGLLGRSSSTWGVIVPFVHHFATISSQFQPASLPTVHPIILYASWSVCKPPNLAETIGVMPVLFHFMNTPTPAAFSYLFPDLSRTF